MHFTKKILIVEDVGLIALDIKAMLFTMGFADVKVVYNGSDAVNYVQTQKPDLILMDITLDEGKNGIETAKEILSRDLIPIIFITGSTDEHTLGEASETEPAAIIYKPVHMPDLEGAVKAVLGTGPLPGIAPL